MTSKLDAKYDLASTATAKANERDVIISRGDRQVRKMKVVTINATGFRSGGLPERVTPDKTGRDEKIVKANRLRLRVAS